MSFRKLTAALLIPMLCLLNVPIAAVASDAPEVETKIVNKPIKKAVSGERITLEATIKDPQGVDVVRAYFKSMQADNYHFVVMENTGGNDYVGILPAAAKNAESIDYLLLVKNGANQVLKTQSYSIPVQDSDDLKSAAATPKEKLQVFTELAQEQQKIVGFSDNIALDVVDSTVKFGVVAGLYSAAAGTSATGTGVVSAGTVTAGTSAVGIGTVALGVVGVAAAGAAAGGGGSGGGGDDGATSAAAPATTAITSADFVGTWDGTIRNEGTVSTTSISYDYSCVWNSTMQLFNDGSVSFNDTLVSSSPANVACSSGTASGTWTYHDDSQGIENNLTTRSVGVLSPGWLNVIDTNTLTNSGSSTVAGFSGSYLTNYSKR